MRHSLNRLKWIFPWLNRREATELDCWRFVERRKIMVRLAPLVVHGYYGKTIVRKKSRDYILIDEKLTGIEFLKAFLHEIGHVCLHEPNGKREVLYLKKGSVIYGKHELEADLFMLYSLIPRSKLWEYANTPFEEIHPMVIEMLIRRQRFYESLGE